MQSTLGNLIDRRHLLRVLVASNLKRQNKSSALGYLWWLLDPMLMTAVYYLVVVVLFDRSGANEPFILFLVCGLLPWKAFSQAVSQSITSLRGARGVVRAISFPKAVLPLGLVVSNTVHFLFALVVVVVIAMAYGIWPTVHYLFLPLIIVFQMLFTAGLCLIMAVLGVFFLDTGNIMSHLLRMWYFLSPGLYSVEQIPESARALFRLNPMCELMTSYRDILMWGKMPTAFDLGYALFAGVACFLVGMIVFKSYEGRLVQKL